MLIVAQKRSSAEEQNEPLPLTSQVDFIARNHISLQQHHCFCGHGEKTQQPGRGGERREEGRGVTDEENGFGGRLAIDLLQVLGLEGDHANEAVDHHQVGEDHQ